MKEEIFKGIWKFGEGEIVEEVCKWDGEILSFREDNEWLHFLTKYRPHLGNIKHLMDKYTEVKRRSAHTAEHYEMPVRLFHFNLKTLEEEPFHGDVRSMRIELDKVKRRNEYLEYEVSGLRDTLKKIGNKDLQKTELKNDLDFVSGFQRTVIKKDKK